MIPIRDTIPARHTAWLVRLLVVANVGLFVYEIFQGPKLEAFLYRYGVVPSVWLEAGTQHVLQWPSLVMTLVTSQFLHGGMLHVGFNMLYLWIFGDNVEDRLGPGRFALLYVGCGMIAALVQVYMQPTASVPMIGASGAIAGVLGAYFLFFPSARIIALLPWVVLELVEVPAFMFLGVWFLLQWLQGMTTIGHVADFGGVAWWAHVSGFLGGLMFGAFLRPRQQYF